MICCRSNRFTKIPAAALAAATGQDGTEMTVVFDAGQNSGANFAVLAETPSTRTMFIGNSG